MFNSLSTIISNKTKPSVWKNKTRAKTKFLVKAGTIKTKQCKVGQGCKGRLEIHHRNYNDPKKIYWLCHYHHISLHKTANEEKNSKSWEKYFRSKVYFKTHFRSILDYIKSEMRKGRTEADIIKQFNPEMLSEYNLYLKYKEKGAFKL
jgi:hypothetical protein